MGPFLIFLLKTLPNSLPHNGGAGSAGRIVSTGFCEIRLVSLSSNRLYTLISDSSVMLLRTNKIKKHKKGT